MALLSELPIIGGKTAEFKRDFEKEVEKLQYGTRLTNSQQVVDFILGYNARQRDIGYTFDEVDSFNEKVENWANSCREFLFWATQGWASGTIITLSPGANKINFDKPNTQVEN